MIITTYKCDLCEAAVDADLPSHRKQNRRLFFAAGDRIELLHVTDKQGSDKIICWRCLDCLKAALAKQP